MGPSDDSFGPTGGGRTTVTPAFGVRETTGPGADVTITGVVGDPKIWNPPAEGDVVVWVAGDGVVTGWLLLLPKVWNPPTEGEVVNWVAEVGVVIGLLLLLPKVGREFILGGVAVA